MCGHRCAPQYIKLCDDVRVCAAHPWQSYYCLVFADGAACGTAMCPNPSYRGNAQFALQ